MTTIRRRPLIFPDADEYYQILPLYPLYSGFVLILRHLQDDPMQQYRIRSSVNLLLRPSAEITTPLPAVIISINFYNRKIWIPYSRWYSYSLLFHQINNNNIIVNYHVFSLKLLNYHHHDRKKNLCSCIYRRFSLFVVSRLIPRE